MTEYRQEDSLLGAEAVVDKAFATLDELCVGEEALQSFEVRLLIL